MLQILADVDADDLRRHQDREHRRRNRKAADERGRSLRGRLPASAVVSSIRMAATRTISRRSKTRSVCIDRLPRERGFRTPGRAQASSPRPAHDN